MAGSAVLGLALGIALMAAATAVSLAAVGAWIRVVAQRVLHPPVGSVDVRTASAWSIIGLLSLFGFFAGLLLTLLSLYPSP